jgi:hypothetical protein
MKKALYILPLFLLAFTSCEQDANVDIPEVDPQLVINCFISPQDDTLRAKISMSTPVFNTSSSNGEVTDATVTLSHASGSVTLVYNAATEYYEAAAALFPIVGGTEYHIVASVPSGMIAEAYTTVPLNAPANFTSTMEDTVTSTDPWNMQGRVHLHYEFDDVAGQTDFYRLVPYEVHYSSWTGDTMLYHAGWELFSDENADGAHLSRNYTFEYYSSGDTVLAFDVYLLHANYDYYSFHRSLENYGGDNPFAEPTLIYTNVKDGLGIFAASNSVYQRHWR